MTYIILQTRMIRMRKKINAVPINSAQFKLMVTYLQVLDLQFKNIVRAVGVSSGGSTNYSTLDDTTNFNSIVNN